MFAKENYFFRNIKTIKQRFAFALLIGSTGD